MNKNVPKLRFKEFEDEWINQTLNSFLEFYTTNSLSRDCLNMIDGEVKNIHYGDIHMKFPTILNLQKDKVPFINNDVDISKIKYDSYCKNGDLVIADASEDYSDIGKTIEIQNIGKNKVVAGLHTILARDIKGITYPGFKGYMMLNELIRKQIKILAAGSKVLGISKSNIAKIKVNIPSLKEQEKIADFFTILDSLIEEQDGKVSDFKIYKKGMMQKIFSQEIRFKDENGCDYPEWKIQRFHEIILKAKLGGNYENSVELTDKPLIKMGNLGRGNMIMDKIEYITKGSEVEEIDLLNEGDLLFNTRNTLDLVGKVAIWKSELKKAYYNSNLLRLEFKKSEVATNKFMNYVFNSHNVLAQLKAIATGTTSVAAIYTRDLNNIKFKLPCLEEQEKIANLLSNIDNIIEEEQNNLDDLKEMKKGLLQKMFI